MRLDPPVCGHGDPAGDAPVTRKGALTAAAVAAVGGALLGPGRASAADDPLDPAVILAPATSARNVIQPTAPNAVPLTVRGATGQSVELQQWQDASGNVVASVQ